MSQGLIHRIFGFATHWAMTFQSIAALFVLNPQQRAYLRALKKSGQLDRAFYRWQNPQLLGIYLVFPERHYIVHGEAAGLFPNQGFSPSAYVRLNPAVSTTEPALWQYLAAGQPSTQQTRDPSPLDPSPLDDAERASVPSIVARSFQDSSVQHPLPQQPLAAVIHIYYPELWPELDAQLQASGLPLDRFITITDLGPEARDLRQDIEARYPNDQIWLMPNHGRDVFPWVALINAGVLNPYQAVCKLHTKRSPHLRDGALWRRQLLEGLLPSEHSQGLVEAFIQDSTLALLVTANQHLKGPKWWGANQVRATELLARASIHPDPNALNFAAGSMFWVKPSLIESIQRLHLSVEDFEPEMGGTDGSTAHAFERVLGYLADHQGQGIGHAEVLLAQSLQTLSTTGRQSPNGAF